MYAIEFEADIQGGFINIPDHYKSLRNQHVRVMILLEDHRNDSDLRVLSDHSAELVDEWHDLAEDDVWK